MRQHRISGRPDARPLPGLLVRVLTVASLAQTTATHSPGQMLPVRLVPEFDVCAARFHWRLSSTAHCQEQHGDRKQNGDRGESFENCWHRVIFFTAVLRIRAVPVAVVAAFNFDRRPPRAVQPPARFRTIVAAWRCHYDARATLDRKRKVPSRQSDLLL